MRKIAGKPNHIVKTPKKNFRSLFTNKDCTLEEVIEALEAANLVANYIKHENLKTKMNKVRGAFQTLLVETRF